MNQVELGRLGALLHGHTWRDSHDWALALNDLAALSDAEIGVVLGAIEGSAATAARPAAEPARADR